MILQKSFWFGFQLLSIIIGVQTLKKIILIIAENLFYATQFVETDTFFRIQ